MNILYVAYPLLPVTEQSAGGAEQMLWTLEREMHARGYQTSVAACAGSRIAGALIATGMAPEMPDRIAQREREHTAVVHAAIHSGDFDLVHDMSGSFWRSATDLGIRVLATLHLPRQLYPPDAFAHIPPNVSFNCVSASQASSFASLPRMCGVVANGIALERFTESPIVPVVKREYLLWMGRICEEKGPHHALDVAHAAGVRVILAGAVYPFLYHQQFHAREVLPRLRRARASSRFISKPSFGEKLGLLCNAKALLLTSTIEETSSLVAMEASACATPVVALRRGAFPEVLAEGVNALLADTFEQMGALLPQVSELSPQGCRAYAAAHYSAGAMADAYEALYRVVNC